jgi:excisionase family DNA binding protein
MENMNTGSGGLLTPEAAASLLSVRQRTLETWRRRATGPAYIRMGRLVRYRQQDVETWLEARAVKA